MTHFLQLGASLYVPATRGQLAAIGNRQKYPHLRSVIFCTEDSIRDQDVPRALDNLAVALRRFEAADLLRFVRVRNPAVLRALLTMEGVDRLSGFVLPKVTCRNLDDYFDVLPEDSAFSVMPTLETVEVFDPRAMLALRDRLLQDRYRRRIVSLRVGGNDLFNLLGLRRPRGRTVYDTPLGPTIAQLITTFRPHGFNLTAPVFEYLNGTNLLAREVENDLTFGLFGKAAIHPEQVAVIESHYRVRLEDLQAAEQIQDERAAPVFRLHDAMCEPATHGNWAALIHERARLYGVRGTALDPSVLGHPALRSATSYGGM
ncbi:MAG: HpcH/HpaI aldolase/citrate lyase family protein [Gemmataceae bacterium]|nr:HpcH/HpaI aldolase/citrate lyase family protein [Gemmataceae bacterium]